MYTALISLEEEWHKFYRMNTVLGFSYVLILITTFW